MRSRKKKHHKNAGDNNAPARQRYWQSGRLRDRKIKALMEHNGMTRAEATALWDEQRTRIKKK